MTKKLTLRESHPPYTLSLEEEDVLGQESIILERDGQPVAAIVPLAEYDAFRAWQEVHFAHETPSPEEILRLAAQVYEGLSSDDVDQIERLALDRSHFLVR
jgi:antitoxin (DNA-binding transcriptional repressor) of toxin-antitoxin stability system